MNVFFECCVYCNYSTLDFICKCGKNMTVEKLKEENEKLKDSLETRVAEVELHFQFIVDNDLEETFNNWIDRTSSFIGDENAN